MNTNSKQTKKKEMFAAVLILMLTLSALTFLAEAAETRSFVTEAAITVSPNPVQVNHPVTVNIWIEPIPPTALDSIEGFMVKIVKPDGTFKNVGPLTAFRTSTQFFSYTPTTTGEYKFEFTYPGQTFKNGTIIYLPSQSSTNLTVQEGSTYEWPQTQPPNDYWTRPVNAENRLWASITGSWFGGTPWAAGSQAGNPLSQDIKAPHIMWREAVDLGGLAGPNGNYYTGLGYEDKIGTVVIMDGYLFTNRHYSTSSTMGFSCYDLRTGELKYFRENVTISYGQELNYVTANQQGIIPYLWQTGSTYRVLDPLTGIEMTSFANASTGLVTYGSDGTMFVYVYLANAKTCWLAMWNSTKCFADNGMITYQTLPADASLGQWRTKTGTYDWLKGIQYNETNPVHSTQNKAGQVTYGSTGRAGLSLEDNILVVFNSGWEDLRMHIGYDLNTGKQLWAFNRTDDSIGYSYCTIAGNGVYAQFSTIGQIFIGYNIRTGQEVWRSDVNPNPPWSMYQGNPVYYKGAFYTATYDGHLNKFDITTGKLAWSVLTGYSKGETQMEGWPIERGPYFSQGAVYISHRLKTPNQPLQRGQELLAYDINSGRLLWNVSGLHGIAGIADGYMVTVNYYENMMTIYGKGPSKTTVSAPQTSVPFGQSVVITGTITDQSTAQLGTACISDQDMADWMDYMYLDYPFPADAKGVPVTLTATGPGGQSVTIATDLTSDVSGNFGCQWCPPSTGLWTITATFRGTDSYGSSFDQTYVGVDPASTTSAVVNPTPTLEPTPSESTTQSATPTAAPGPKEAPNTMLYVGIAAVAIIIVVAAIALVLRRRK
jgi:outer membrane protein assembly factor BamB